MLDERSLIKKIIKTFKTNRDDVIVGVGDDAAVLKNTSDRYLLATCDSQIGGVHFERTKITPEVLAKCAVTAVLSDIAAMGGTPTYMLTSVVFPKTTTERFLNELIGGFAKAASEYNVAIVGGNISRGKQFMIDIFALGFVKPNEVLYRSGAKPGDAVLVTGRLGEKKVGKARLKEAALIAKTRLATAMIDISDGLSTDLLHICEASSVGVRIYADKLPISRVSSQGSTLYKVDPYQKYDLALNGGEDYELCFTANAKNAKKLIARVKRETGTDVTIIGEMLPKKEGRWLVDEKGRERKLEARGWNHFRSEKL